MWNDGIPFPLLQREIVLDGNRDKRHPDLNETATVNWAAPVPPSALKLPTRQINDEPRTMTHEYCDWK